MELNEHPENLKVGDKVRTWYEIGAGKVTRRITSIEYVGTRWREDGTGSGYLASADPGEPCPHCNRLFAQPTGKIDAAWFIPVEEAEGD